MEIQIQHKNNEGRVIVTGVSRHHQLAYNSPEIARD